ncbi:diguanylate cyclase [Arenimonas sp. MALMAid1274]|uniref:diguanylate cyclase n=1 Tax=Arenimonas sp. MALMAid1274 TaxID=3411630 RepID=UPI003BA1AF47
MDSPAPAETQVPAAAQSPATASTPVPGAKVVPDEATRTAVAEWIDTLRPWASTLGAFGGTGAELRWRHRHARLAQAAQSPHVLDYWRKQAALGRATGFHPYRKRAQSEISNLGYRRGDYALTQAIEEEALADARRYGDLRDEAGSLQDLGLVATATGQPDLAEQRFNEALAIWNRLDDPLGKARALRGLGRVQEVRGRYPQAMATMVSGLELMLQHGSQIEQSESYYSLARLFLNLEDYDAAHRAINEAIRLMGPTPPDFPLGLNLVARSTIRRHQERYDQAAEDGVLAQDAFARARSPLGGAIAQLALGQARVAQGQPEAGLAMLAEGVDTARGLGETTLVSDLLLAQGGALISQGQYDQALPLLTEAYAIGEQLGLDRLRQDVSLAMESLHSGRGDSAQALLWSRRAFDFRGRLSGLQQLGDQAQSRLDDAAEARKRFMAIDPAQVRAEREPAQAPTAPPPSRAWMWLLLLPSLLLLWGLLRVVRHARGLRAEKDRMHDRQRELESAHLALQSQSEYLRRQVSVDPLTGAMTRSAFAAELEALLAHAAAHHQRVALMVLDLDNFKQINDRHGHLAGDAALQLVVGIARGKLRSEDLLGRFGGDEFLIACRGLDLAAAEALAETIRFDVVWRGADQDPPMAELGISVGVALADVSQGYATESLFRRADTALYEAKRAGRNRVHTAQGDVQPPPATEARLRKLGAALDDTPA